MSKVNDYVAKRQALRDEIRRLEAESNRGADAPDLSFTSGSFKLNIAETGVLCNGGDYGSLPRSEVLRLIAWLKEWYEDGQAQG